MWRKKEVYDFTPIVISQNKVPLSFWILRTADPPRPAHHLFGKQNQTKTNLHCSISAQSGE